MVHTTLLSFFFFFFFLIFYCSFKSGFCLFCFFQIQVPYNLTGGASFNDKPKNNENKIYTLNHYL